MTGTQLITRVRRSVSDSVATFRWSDPDLALYISDGLRALWKDHPEAFMVRSIVVTEPTEIAEDDLGEALPIDDRWLNALQHYVAYRVLAEDSEDAANRTLSGEHYTLFEREMV